MERQIAAGDLDEFQLVRPLGKGGMGEVYLGHDTVLDRAVAIKLIGASNPDAGSRERFLIEARAIARLSHPNVVTIFRVGATTDGRPFLVQELIRGKSLDRVQRPMPWRDVCELAIGIARGLDAAHRRGILHRDVKPANVMLDDNGAPRLLDFGLAKLGEVAPRPLPIASGLEALGVATTRDAHVDVAATRDVPVPPSSTAMIARSPSSPPVTFTAPGSVIGTPRYTAPENWRGEPSTERSDLYSLGALLYELLTDAPPHPETDIAELERAVLAGQTRPILELAPDTHASLAELVTRCLAREPAERPASAAELAHALEGVLVDAPMVPEGNPYRGLRAFDAESRAVFFGRGADVGAIVDRLRTESLVVVVGDSGIGKSSVCHAGVVPAIETSALGDGRTWRAVTIPLGRTPWTALCEVLGVPTSLDARSLRQAAGAGLLLVVDQLEELVTLAEPDEAARVSELLAAIAAGVPGVKSLLAVRGDFLTRVAALPSLGGPMTRGLHLLRVLSRDDLQEAIVGPARAKGVRYETPAMVDELVAAVVHNPGALPLLQFTLAELWQSREHDVIPAAALASLGGVDGALAGHADRVLLGLGTHERDAARRIVMRLVTDARTRAVRPRDELASDPTSVQALESLVRGRLVVARDTIAGTPSYEIAHEALIRSWHTLRDWLDEAAGEHAARNRLVASAGEWQRLERKPDLLWSRRQLDELRSLDDLNPTEGAFITASQAQLRRRRIARIAAIVAVPLVATAIYTAVRFEAARRRDREVAARIAVATEQREFGKRLAVEAARVRARAFEYFEAARTNDGELTWGVAQTLSRAADGAYRGATNELEGAFMVEPTAVRAPMAQTLWAHAELAEGMFRHDLVISLLARLATYDRARREQWEIPAHITLAADLPATLTLHAARPTGTLAGGFEATPIATGQQLDMDLRAGSYLVIATPASGDPVRFAIAVARGERFVETIEMPRGRIEGYAYVPAGRFLTGTDRDERVRLEFQRTTPLHFSHTESFWISRTELTFGEWIEFLRDMPLDQRAAFLPNTPGNQRFVRLVEQDGKFVLEFDPSETVLRAVEGDPLVYTNRGSTAVRWDRIPVVGVTAKAGAAYATWLDRTKRVPGARLCTVREWEHAARGADGRSFPHGESLAPYQANHDATYRKVGYGLDEVGSFPASDSPFGVHDLAGNASELVVLPVGVGLKGGSFFQSPLTAMSSNNSSSTEKMAFNTLGLRLCADAAR
jgi:eukaryotic-like serine/threonine-protein kinase